jgi:hypothetical protein
MGRELRTDRVGSLIQALISVSLVSSVWISLHLSTSQRDFGIATYSYSSLAFNCSHFCIDDPSGAEHCVRRDTLDPATRFRHSGDSTFACEPMKHDDGSFRCRQDKANSG